MKHLVTCANAGEAGFYQSLLASAGIDAEIRDSRSNLGGVSAAELFVAEEQYAEAAALLAAQSPGKSEPTTPSRHPAAGFPFLGITGFIAIIWSLGVVAVTVRSTESGTWNRLGASKFLVELFGVGAAALLWGLLIGGMVALFCLIAKITWQKLRA